MEEHFTPKQIAEALRVSESSIKRWCDAGSIPTIRTSGGHRKISLEGLVKFLDGSDRGMYTPRAIGMLSQTRARQAPVPSTNPAPTDNFIDEFEEALIDGDEQRCRRIALRWYTADPSIARFADRLICESFKRIGNLWECENLDVYKERRGCEICNRVLHEFRHLIPEPKADGPVAIGGTPEGDNYSIPTQLIELVMRESGWRATNLGANLPLRSLLNAVHRYQPKLVWLSVSHIENRESFLSEYQAFATAIPSNVALIVGGRALDDAIRPQLHFTAHCDNLQQLSNLAIRLCQNG